MQTMIDIEGRIISTDILTARFACDISICRGACCVEGNAGAPLEPEEESVLREEYPNFKEYIPAAGIEAIREQGFAVVDEDGDLTTPLVGDAECAYAYQVNGVTLCAIEKAYRQGKTKFMKPISCHLYPIRVTRFSDGSEGLNYHRWSICSSARHNGQNRGIALYRALREPIVRRFGEDFFAALEEAEKYLTGNEI